jgi:hypothetical protein
MLALSKDWNFTLSADDILRGQGADPQIVRTSKPRLLAAAEHILAEGLLLLHPAALTSQIGVREHRHERILLENGKTLTGSLVTRHFAGAQRVIAVVCTIGPELEQAVSRLLIQDPLAALALDGLGNAAVENLAQLVCGQIGEQIQAEQLQASTPLSPGSPDWPVEVGQPQIFAMLDSIQAGISLSTSGMMSPKKSMSFVVGLGSEMSQAGMCEVCSLKETCRYQNA